jgi:uncharacterized metal-binding protein YceD (DUF177 family)
MSEHSVRLALPRLSRGAETPVAFVPDAQTRNALAEEMGLLGLRKLRLRGRVIPEGTRDWRLEATMGATVVQACVVTAEPVTTRLDEAVTRRYLAQMPEPEGGEIEMPEDDTAEPLPPTLDLEVVLAEALALALPLYPRAEGAALGAANFAAPGVAPMTDEDAKPLAGLAALRDRMTGRADSGEED